MAQIWTVVTLLSGAIFTGAISLFAWERVWLWRRMALDEFAVDFRRSLGRVDPAMPILLVISAVGALGLASESHGAKRMLLLAALTGQLVVFAGSAALAVPLNQQFR